MEKAKKTILIFGAGGMLGSALVNKFKPKYRVIPLRHKDCDITDDKEVTRIISRYQPWLVINAAAYTDVDGCEKNPKKAYTVNARGAFNLARAAQEAKAVVIYISTDYVFNGRARAPYREDSLSRPLSVYAKTKLKGEELVRSVTPRHIIIRTSWLFGNGKNNFVDTILKRAKHSQSIKAVDGKYSSPTYSIDLAEALFKMTELLNSRSWSDSFYGTYHITNSGYCSWYEYAKVIIKSAKLNRVKVMPIPMAEINFIAQRPRFSALDNSKYLQLTKSRLRHWQEAVKEYVGCRRRN